MPASSPYEIGATVYARDGEIGPLDAVVDAPNGAGSPRLIVRGRNRHFEVPTDLIDTAASSPAEIRLTISRAALEKLQTELQTAANAPTQDHITVPIHEEILVPVTRPVELGSVRVHKRVESVPYDTTLNLTHDEVSVERVPINRPVETMPEPHYDGDTLVVPVVEEVLVKRLMLREELRITRRQVTEPTPIRDTVRREVVEIEGRGSVEVLPPEPPRGDSGAAGAPGH